MGYLFHRTRPLILAGCLANLLSALLMGCTGEPANFSSANSDPAQAQRQDAANHSYSGVAPQTSAASDSSSSSVPSGARAAKIIFRNSSTGSFDDPSSSGTAPTPGSGHSASRAFYPDDSLLASGGPSSSTWPKWLSSFEIGISGSKNTAATNADCARFATTDEDTATLCDFNADGTAETACGAPSGLFRVSEFDCGRGTIATGDGGPGDGVYIRATFSRDTTYLGGSENILVVLEYAASVLNGAPTKPTSCFTNGTLDPTNTECTDMSWNIFLKDTTSDTVQPFLMLVPPAFAYVDTANTRGGSGVMTRQFVLPLAGDSELSVMQISRIKALANTAAGTTYYKACNGASTPSNSALCVGMIFHSITFYRM